MVKGGSSKRFLDYGNTSIEARYIFFRRLIPLLKFGREREEVDTSSIVLSHYKLSTKGERDQAKLTAFARDATEFELMEPDLEIRSGWLALDFVRKPFFEGGEEAAAGGQTMVG